MKELCRLLGVSESGYYCQVKNKGKLTRDEFLSVEMKRVLDEHPCNDNYGVERMRLALAQRGIRAGIWRLTRLMREHGWLHARKRHPKGLTKADPAVMKSENLIKQDFSADRPFQKLLTEPITGGDSCFLVMPYCNTVCMNVFLEELSKQYPEDVILLCCDSAAWHKSKSLQAPENIELFYIPPYTSEMDPIEQIWKELRKLGFRGE